MRSPSKRSRSKSNRPKPLGNIVNRVFESSGPEGKVRGTPQQIIDKYLTLARDAQLSGDRVASENFLQHGEHYARMLNDAQREMAREAEARREQSQNGQQSGQHGGRRGEAQQDSQSGGHHAAQNGSNGRQDQGAGSGRASAGDNAAQAGRDNETQTDGQREPQHDAGAEQKGESAGGRRAAGRNRRRDQKSGDQQPDDQMALTGADMARSGNPGQNREEAAGLAERAGLADDGDAALVDTPEGRAARQVAQGNANENAAIPDGERSDVASARAAPADTATAEAGPRFVTEAQPAADDGAASAEPASADASGKPRRKPAARKPRASTATRRSPRSKAQDSDDAAPANGSSNAAE